MTTPATDTPASPAYDASPAQEATLLPCPSGHQVDSHECPYPTDRAGGNWIVHCVVGDDCCWEVNASTREQAVEQWNSRAAAIAPPKEATPPALTEEQRAALKRAILSVMRDHDYAMSMATYWGQKTAGNDVNKCAAAIDYAKQREDDAAILRALAKGSTP